MFNIASLTDYTAKSNELFRAGVLYSEDFSEFSYQTGVMYKEFINYINVAPIVQAGSCGATDSGTTTLSEKVITVVPEKTDLSFCFDDLYKKAITDLDVAGSITADFNDKMKQNLEKSLWQGDSFGVTGWLAEAVADSDVNDVSGSTLTITNIDDEIQKMINAITDPMRSRGILTIYVSYATFGLYKQNRLAANYYRDANTDMGVNEMWVFGYENQVKIKAVAGLNGKNDNMIMSYGKNFLIGTDDVNSLTSAKWVIDEVTEYAWLKAKWKIGATYHFGTEIVLWSVA